MIVKWFRKAGHEQIWDNVQGLVYEDNEDRTLVQFDFISYSNGLSYATRKDIRDGIIRVYEGAGDAIATYRLGTDRGI
jgi:hypothetical protein